MQNRLLCQSYLYAVAGLWLVSCSAARPTFRAAVLNPNVYRTYQDLTVTPAPTKQLPNPGVEKVTIQVLRNSDPTVASTDRELDFVDYKVVAVDGKQTIIKVLPHAQLKDYIVSVVEDEPSEKYDASGKLWQLPTDKLTAATSVLLGSKFVGVPLLFPFKLRASSSDLRDHKIGAELQTDFTLGYVFGYRMRLSESIYRKNFVSIVPYGFGIGNTKYTYYNSATTVADRTDAACVTWYTGGILFTLNRVNIGAFVGLDAMVSRRNDWIYQSTPWYSFGLGFKFKDD